MKPFSRWPVGGFIMGTQSIGKDEGARVSIHGGPPKVCPHWRT